MTRGELKTSGGMPVTDPIQTRDQWSRGQTMTEYVLIVSSIALALVLLYQQAGNITSFLVDQVVPLF